MSARVSCLLAQRYITTSTWRQSAIRRLNMRSDNIVCLQKTAPLQLIWHNFTNSQHSLIIFGRERPYSILQYYDKKFLNWLRISCVVSITTVATLHTWTADFWANFIGKRVAKRLWAYVNAERQHSNTCYNLWYHKTFYYSDRNTVYLKDLPLLFVRQHKLWNDAQLRIATVTRFSWYFAANTTVF